MLDSLIQEFPGLTITLQPFKDLVDLIATGWEKIANFIKSISLDSVKDIASNAWGGVKDFFGFGGDDKKQANLSKQGVIKKVAAQDDERLKWIKEQQAQLAKEVLGERAEAIKINNVNIKADAPLMPAQASVVNNSTASSSNVTNNNNINNTFNVTNATPKQFVAQAAPAIIRSIDAQTQQAGRL